MWYTGEHMNLERSFGAPKPSTDSGSAHESGLRRAPEGKNPFSRAVPPPPPAEAFAKWRKSDESGLSHSGAFTRDGRRADEGDSGVRTVTPDRGSSHNEIIRLNTEQTRLQRELREARMDMQDARARVQSIEARLDEIMEEKLKLVGERRRMRLEPESPRSRMRTQTLENLPKYERQYPGNPFAQEVSSRHEAAISRLPRWTDPSDEYLDSRFVEEDGPPVVPSAARLQAYKYKGNLFNKDKT